MSNSDTSVLDLPADADEPVVDAELNVLDEDDVVVGLAPGRRISLSVSARGLLGAVVMVALLATSVTFGWLYFDAHRQLAAQAHDAQNNSHAEKTAIDYAGKAATMNYKDLNGWKTNLVAGTSPELTEKLTKAAVSMEQILVPMQWVSTAQPITATVRSVNAGVYVVSCFVSVQTKTAQSPETMRSTATYSITVDSNKDWQITDVGGIGTAVGQN